MDNVECQLSDWVLWKEAMTEGELWVPYITRVTYIANSCKEIRKNKNTSNPTPTISPTPHVFHWIFLGVDFGPFWVPKFTTSFKEISYFICLEKKKNTPLPLG